MGEKETSKTAEQMMQAAALNKECRKDSYILAKGFL